MKTISYFYVLVIMISAVVNCKQLETPEHALIHCTHYLTHRTALQTTLNLNKALILETILNPQNKLENFMALGVFLIKTELIKRI